MYAIIKKTYNEYNMEEQQVERRDVEVLTKTFEKADEYIMNNMIDWVNASIRWGVRRRSWEMKEFFESYEIEEVKTYD